MKKHKNPFRKPEEAWKITKEGILLKYPIFHHDPSIPDDPIIKKTIKEVVGDVDFWGWEGGKEDRIVDSTGKVFITKFEKVKNGRNFLFIPITVQSGMFPGEVERVMDITEVKDIMSSAIEGYKFRIKRDVEELKREIEILNSIDDVITFCGNYV
jgi:hypothetical protein